MAPETNLAQLLIRLERDQETGVLYLHHGTLQRSFFFGAGRCVFAASNDPDDRLVSYLFQRGIISLDDKEEMSRRLLTNRRVGTILREIGAIDDALAARLADYLVAPLTNHAGLRVGEVAEVLQTTLQGEVVGEVLEGQRRFDLVVKFSDEARRNTDSLASILIDTPDGQLIPLRTVANIVESKGPNQILRENVQRRIVVQCNVSGRDLGGVIADIQDLIAEHISLPEGYFITYGGQFESQQQATRTLLLLIMFSLAAIFALLYAHFKSAWLVVQVMSSILFAFIGSVTALLIAGESISVASMVGFISLTGIASRNGILMISHYIHLMTEEGMSFSREMVIRGSQERVAPVLMTALTTGLALVPLVLAKGEAGKEILYPVALAALTK